MSSLLTTYEHDFQSLYENMKKEVNEDLRGQGEQRTLALRSLAREMDEASEILDQMEIEIQSLPPSTRTKYQSKLSKYKGDIDKIKSDVRQANVSDKNGLERAQLLQQTGGNSSMAQDYESERMDQRSRLFKGTEQLANATKKLEEAHRVAIETGDVGRSVLTDLQKQREQIGHTRSTLRGADAFIDQSQRKLKSIAQRMAAHRMVTYGIIVTLVALIIIILWIKFG